MHFLIYYFKYMHQFHIHSVEFCKGSLIINPWKKGFYFIHASFITTPHISVYGFEYQSIIGNERTHIRRQKLKLGKQINYIYHRIYA